MKFFGIFRQKKIRPAWEFKAKGFLWRIVFSGDGRIVGEDRDQTAKSVSFFCLDEITGRVLWSGLEFSEKWWIGIEAIDGGIVFFHEYVKPDLPQHFKILAVDVETGKLLWRNDELQPFHIAKGKVFAVKDLFEKRIYYQLNTATGEVEKEFSEQDENIGLISKGRERGDGATIFPEILSGDVEGYDRLADVIRPHCDRSRVEGNVEFILHGDLLIFNYHETAKSRIGDERLLKNHLKVVRLNRKHLLYSDLITENAHAPVPDSFFLKGGQLFFVKERNRLVAIRLEALQSAP